MVDRSVKQSRLQFHSAGHPIGSIDGISRKHATRCNIVFVVALLLSGIIASQVRLPPCILVKNPSASVDKFAATTGKAVALSDPLQTNTHELTAHQCVCGGSGVGATDRQNVAS